MNESKNGKAHLKKITETELRTLRAINRLTTEQDGLPPTTPEISAALGMRSHNSARKYITRLAARGLLRCLLAGERRRPRGLRITDEGRRMLAGEISSDDVTAGAEPEKN